MVCGQVVRPCGCRSRAVRCSMCRAGVVRVQMRPLSLSVRLVCVLPRVLMAAVVGRVQVAVDRGRCVRGVRAFSAVQVQIYVRRVQIGRRENAAGVRVEKFPPCLEQPYRSALRGRRSGWRSREVFGGCGFGCGGSRRLRMFLWDKYRDTSGGGYLGFGVRGLWGLYCKSAVIWSSRSIAHLSPAFASRTTRVSSATGL